MRVVWTESAQTDIARQVEYVAAFNPHAAAHLLRSLRTAGNSLSTFPRRGRSRPEGTRELAVVYPFVLVYRVDDDVVTVLRVWHGAQERAAAGLEEDAAEYIA